MVMEYQTVLFDKSNHIRTVTLNRPEVLNALNTRVFEELMDIFCSMDADRDVRCVIITGSGRAFAAGADIGEELNNTVKEENQFLRNAHRVMETVENFRAPVIAAVNGYALGGGLELAMACDLRIASCNAKMGMPEAALGSIPAFGGTHRLPALVGLARAKEMFLTARHISAHEAYEYGLVQQVVPAAELMETAVETAERIAAYPPMAVEYGKIAITAGFWSDPKTSMETEIGIRAQLQDSKDRKEAYTAFVEKRKPAVFKGE